jgi:hypothetical protein
MKLAKLDYMGNTESAFLGDAGIKCNKAPMTAALLKDTIRSTMEVTLSQH